jgi:hypothetical protein
MLEISASPSPFGRAVSPAVGAGPLSSRSQAGPRFSCPGALGTGR